MAAFLFYVEMIVQVTVIIVLISMYASQWAVIRCTSARKRNDIKVHNAGAVLRCCIMHAHQDAGCS